MSCKAAKCVFNIVGGGCAVLGFFPEARISSSGKCELYNEDTEYYKRLLKKKKRAETRSFSRE
ncbi:MAG TPA: hypothetical protein PKY81_17015 [bacterium]|nr:hypothetical protein [bacterium]